MRASLAAIALVAGVAECTLIPDYRPALPVSGQWPSGPAAQAASPAPPAACPHGSRAGATPSSTLPSCI
jgi:hypothetical protein